MNTSIPDDEHEAEARLQHRLAALSPEKRAVLERRLLDARSEARLATVTRRRRTPALLSFAQETMWLVDRMSPDASRAAGGFDVRAIRGPLDAEALRRALRTVVDRHESLRTTFEVIDGAPMQIVHDDAPFDVAMIDAREMTAEQRAWELRAFVNEPFELSRLGLFRARLLHVADDEHVLLVGVHHIVWDGWSHAIVFRELVELYDAYCRGRAPRLAQPVFQYAEFAVWQRGWLRGDTLERELTYWREKLAGAPRLIGIPTDRPRPAVNRHRGDCVEFWIEAPTVAALSGLAQRETATLFMVLVAAWATLLHRHGGGDEVVLGTPIAGRNRVEFEQVVGYFINTLPLRIDCRGDPTIRALIGRVRETALGAYAHQDVSFEQVVRAVASRRDLSFTPIFQSLIVLHDPESNRPELPGLTMEAVETHPGTAMFDLSLSMTQREQRLHARLEYSRDLFDRVTIERMRDQFVRLASALARDPLRRLWDLELLTAEEQQGLLLAARGAEAAIPDVPVHVLVRRAASSHAQRPAVVGPHETLTFAELDARSDALAASLRARGVRRGSSVALLLERSPGFVVAMLAVLKAGAACVALDPTYPSDRLRGMIDDASVALVLVDARWRDSAEGFGASLLAVDAAVGTGPQARVDSSDCRSDDVAFVLYTSGSTGSPKGVLLEHRGLVNLALATIDCFELTPGDRVLQFASPSFDISLEEIFGSLLSGATLVLRVESTPLAGPGLVAWLAREGVTVMDLPTAFWHEWVRDLDDLGLRPPSCLRLVVVGGEKASAPALAVWRRIAGGVRWLNTYGPTEATVTTTIYAPPDDWSHDDDRELPIGWPIQNVTVHILDRNRRPVPPGVHGELYIGGAGVARGYVASRATAERFVCLPWAGGERVYRTGDIVWRRAGGPLEFVGRVDREIKLRGFRIEPAEVEAALLRDERVTGALALLRDDRHGRPALIAYAVVRAADRADLGHDLRKRLTQALPAYALPSTVTTITSFPLTTSGKVDIDALPAPRSEATSRGVAPRDELEAAIAAIWSDLLGCAVGIDDDFFEIGGHSLLAARMIALLERRLDVALPLAALIRAPTVSDLAEVVRDREGATRSETLVALRPEGMRPPLFLIHDLSGELLCYRELVRCLPDDQPVYGIQQPAEDAISAREMRIEEMARCYVEELRSVRPGGPYLLAGWSFAGVVAYEIARQLRRSGDQIALVGLIDAIPDELALHVAPVAPRPDAPPSRSADARARNRAALCAYTTPGYGGPVTLFRACPSAKAPEGDPRLRWSGLAAGGLHVRDVVSAGVGHLTLLAQPHVARLADELDAAIRGALGARG